MQQTILIIDTTQVILELMELILTDAGYQVITAEQALPLSQITSLSPDLVIIEDWLHGHSCLGSEICKAIKSLPSAKNIPALLMSTLPDLSVTANNAQADGIIPKPFNIDELVSLVSKVLRGPAI